MGAGGAPPRAVIFGCAATVLSDAEKAFFARTDPLGFILFRRNIETPDQVRALVAALRDSVGRAAPVLVDQEGGRVQRLRPPHWHALPPAAAIGQVAARDRSAGERAAWSAGRLIASDLAPLGIDVDCAPVADLRFAGAHDVIGDRAFASDPEAVSALALAFAAGLAAGRVTPVVKHMPGHGRATVDSHHALPVVSATLVELEQTDFAAFRPLANLPWGISAHVLYTALDADRAGTCSRTVIDRAIRGAIGFDGLLLTDDISMQALGGSIAERAAAALDAGCDVALHCTGDLVEMEAVAAVVGRLSTAGSRRLVRARQKLELILHVTSGSVGLAADTNSLERAVQLIES
jgi:beta-N-acetylhexosaminidase